MSASREARLLLRLYPPGWRARYGEELTELIVESSGRDGVPWRIRADVALAAGRERLASSGLTGGAAPPRERARAGSLLVLCAWAAFALAGGSVSKLSEHWQSATPAAGRGVPSAAFDVLIGGAVVGGLLVLAGIASALPALLRFLRGGGWPAIRRGILVATLASAVAVAATVALAAWAHRLDGHQRNGGDLAYTVAFAAWGLLAGAGTVAAWAAAAVSTARRLTFTAAVTRLHAALAAGVTLAMGLMTAATVVWWVALARTAPQVLSGTPGSAVAPQLVGSTLVMLAATLAGAYGAARALRGSRATGSPIA